MKIHKGLWQHRPTEPCQEKPKVHTGVETKSTWTGHNVKQDDSINAYIVNGIDKKKATGFNTVIVIKFKMNDVWHATFYLNTNRKKTKPSNA